VNYVHRNMAFAPPANLVAEAKASNFPTTFVPTPHPPAGPPPPSSVPGPCLPSGPPPGGGPPPPNMSEATHVNLAAIAAAANAAIAASVQDAARKSGFSSGPPPGGATGGAFGHMFDAAKGYGSNAKKKVNVLAALEGSMTRVKKAMSRNLDYLQKLDDGDIDAAEDKRRRKKLKAGGVFGMQDDGMEEKKPARKDNAVYVVGLPVDNNEEIVQGALEKLMGKAGPVQKTKLYKDEDKNLKGDALVIYRSEGSAMTAVRMFNDIEMIPGQKLTVTMANWGDATNEGGGGADGPGEVADIQLEQESTYDMNAAIEQARQAATDAANATEEAMQKIEKGEDGTIILAATGGMSDRAKLEASLLGIKEGEADFTLVVVRQVWTCEEILQGCEVVGEYNPGLFFCELEEELNAEVGKYGGVLALAALTETPDGQIGIRYSDAVTAARGIDVMDGRGFAGRTLKAEYYDGTPHHCGTDLPRWRTGAEAPAAAEEAPAEEAPADKASGDNPSQVTSSTPAEQASQKSEPPPEPEEEEPLPDGWMGYKTKEGRPYFHNKLLGSTVWSKPRLSKTERERWRKKREAEKKAASKSTEDKTLAAFLSGV